MKQRLMNILQTMDYNDLRQLKWDLDKGNFDFNAALMDIIRKKEKTHKKYCSCCGSDILPSENSYTMLFGPDDFRKKATFCGRDCMASFMQKLELV